MVEKKTCIAEVKDVKYEGDTAYIEYYTDDKSSISIPDIIFWFPTTLYSPRSIVEKVVIVTLPESEMP